MNRVSRREEGVVVELHDNPCRTTEDYEQIKQLLLQAGRDHVRLIIDCSSVQVVGGRFFSALLLTFRQLGARPGDVILCGLAPVVRQVFEVTKLDQFFPIYDTREEALRADWPEPRPTVVADGES